MASFFGQTIFSCPIYQNYGRILADRVFEPPGFTLGLRMKDMRLVRDTAEAAHVPMPLADLLHARLLSGLSNQRVAAISIGRRSSCRRRKMPVST